MKLRVIEYKITGFRSRGGCCGTSTSANSLLKPAVPCGVLTCFTEGAGGRNAKVRKGKFRFRSLAGSGDFEAENNGNGSSSPKPDNGFGFQNSSLLDSTSLPENFSIIESSETMKDFGSMDLKDLQDNITARRNTIFLLMEEVRRLRIQVKSKDGVEKDNVDERENERYSSAIPFLPPIGLDTLKYYYWVYGFGVAGLVIFGGLIAPALEVRLGFGGLSYLEFIESIGLPRQLALVDPIVASFVGGAVGVLSALLVVEVNNLTEREKEKCFYCGGSGYLSCGECGGTGIIGEQVCPSCSKTGKVMCTTCLCTGRLMATEHDPR